MNEVVKNFDADNAVKDLGTVVTRVSHDVIPVFDANNAVKEEETKQ